MNTTPEEEYRSGLRGKIVDVICHEWPNLETNELEVRAILGWLQSEGVEASEGVLVSEQDVAYILSQMAGRGDIALALPTSSDPPTTDIVIRGVSETLCKQPRKPHSPGPSREPPGGWVDSAL